MEQLIDEGTQILQEIRDTMHVVKKKDSSGIIKGLAIGLIMMFITGIFGYVNQQNTINDNQLILERDVLEFKEDANEVHKDMTHVINENFKSILLTIDTIGGRQTHIQELKPSAIN